MKIEENTGYLYRHIRLDTNEVFYIGVGMHNTDKKFKRAYFKYNRNNIWNNIVSKTDYIVEIMMMNIPDNLLFKKEMEFIKIYGRKNMGRGTLANLTDGGEGFKGLIRKKSTTPHPRLGIKMPEEQRLAMIGRKLSKEHREKISKANKGRKLSKEQVQFLKNRGMSHITPKVRKIKQLSLDGEYIKTWNSIQECVDYIGCHHSSIVHCCRGNKKTCKGFKWEYYDE